jgi:membrane protease YdiL (CAAX protease family)
MPDFSAAAEIIQLSQWALAVGGLVLVAVWFLAPKCQPLRTQPALVPEWDNDLPDTLLVGCVIPASIFLGLAFATSITRSYGLAASDGWTSVIFALGLHGAVVVSVAGLGVYKRSVGRPLPPAGRSPAAPLTDRILLGAAVICGAMPFVLAGSFASAEAMKLLGLEVKLQDLAGFFTTSNSPLLVLALTIVATVVAPLSEELLFRAGLFRIFRRFLPRWGALLLSGALFAALHWNVVHFLPLTVLGVVFALAYEKSGSLVVPVVAHGLFNLNSIVNLLAGVGGPS